MVIDLWGLFQKKLRSFQNLIPLISRRQVDGTISKSEFLQRLTPLYSTSLPQFERRHVQDEFVFWQTSHSFAPQNFAHRENFITPILFRVDWPPSPRSSLFFHSFTLSHRLRSTTNYFYSESFTKNPSHNGYHHCCGSQCTMHLSLHFQPKSHKRSTNLSLHGVHSVILLYPSSKPRAVTQ